METYSFEPCQPARRSARQGAGRRPEENPFESAVREIAGKVDNHGVPLARQAQFTLDVANGETLKQRSARIRRFLTRAGKEVAQANGRDRAYNVAMVVEESSLSGVYVVKFWDRRAGQDADAPDSADGQGEQSDADVREPAFSNA